MSNDTIYLHSLHLVPGTTPCPLLLRPHSILLLPHSHSNQLIKYKSKWSRSVIISLVKENNQLIFVSFLPIPLDSIIHTMLPSTYRRSPDHHSYHRSFLHHSSLLLTRLVFYSILCFRHTGCRSTKGRLLRHWSYQLLPGIRGIPRYRLWRRKLSAPHK
jgi:hypothetical protein